MKRLIDELEEGPRRALIASAESDTHRPEGRERALAAGLALLSGSGGASGSEGAPNATSGSVSSKGLPGLATRKVAIYALAGVVAAAVVGAITLGGRAPVTKSPPPTSTGATSALPREPDAEALKDTGVVTLPNVVEPPALASSPASPASTTASPGSRRDPTADGAKSADVLAREVRAIEATRTALAAGDPARALRELDDYDRIQGAHTLRPEARVLRVEALARAGRSNEARVLGASLRADPSMAAYVRRLDRVLGGDESHDGGS